MDAQTKRLRQTSASTQIPCIHGRKISNFSRYLKKGKDVVDRQVEKSLLQRALGYSYEETSKKYEGGVMTERKVTKKHVPPDTTAQIFWLKNRKPEQWRDKPRSESASDKALVKAIEILGGVDSAID